MMSSPIGQEKKSGPLSSCSAAKACIISMMRAIAARNDRGGIVCGQSFPWSTAQNTSSHSFEPFFQDRQHFQYKVLPVGEHRFR